MRICLLNNESIVATTLQSFLFDLGYEVVSVASVSELLDHPEEIRQPLDLIISDFPIPGAHGLTQIGEVHRQYPDVPIVMMTDKRPRCSSREAISNGVYAYLRKPISLGELELLLVRVSERRAVRRAKATGNSGNTP